MYYTYIFYIPVTYVYSHTHIYTYIVYMIYRNWEKYSKNR